jgi:hypothetical protein
VSDIFEDYALVKGTVAAGHEFDSAGIAHEASKSVFFGTRVGLYVNTHVLCEVFIGEWSAVEIADDVVNGLMELGIGCIFQQVVAVQETPDARSLLMRRQ